jgi:hypothetical protein
VGGIKRVAIAGSRLSPPPGHSGCRHTREIPKVTIRGRHVKLAEFPLKKAFSSMLPEKSMECNKFAVIEKVETRDSSSKGLADIKIGIEKVGTRSTDLECTETLPPLTFKRGMVLFSLTLLFVTSAVPNYLLLASLCTCLLTVLINCSLHGRRYWR